MDLNERSALNCTNVVSVEKYICKQTSGLSAFLTFLVEMDDEDVHHVDFTTASTLEVFIARIKEVFIDWGLNQVDQSVWKGDYNKGVWSTQSETIILVDPESVWDDGSYKQIS